ncbi:MAG: HK97 family phage prohead protease [Staphylococcus equorum]|uniref:HK97 family phage prohead protease n=1 Tax=Staphylococcus TaxID=1279 RepID=UPI00265305E0|nr:HK97 family phage prohead protease [Staphylococcus equorum]MDN6570975.1 HK97 family phage prohead protease [Staphylococcus equorum]MDN6610532.1 HK97 family phage prohead protease [Staphylococcus equorum]MDN6741285.1 HK97 family phage prohead protease [Staphylococcus equorum]MDN6749074.1 HK97 family phage prohead protease [Staphylococcus equorum]
MIVEGYALRFNTLSNDLGGFVETISPQALKDADLSDVRCLIDHDSSKVLGRTTSKTLDLKVDDEGLYFRCQLPDTSYSRDLYENIRVGNINQCSFGFILDDDGDTIEKRDDGLFKRTLNKIRSLFDVSVVTYPAYNDTDVAPALRSIEAVKEQEQEEIRMRQQEEIRTQNELLKLQLDLLKTK